MPIFHYFCSDCDKPYTRIVGNGYPSGNACPFCHSSDNVQLLKKAQWYSEHPESLFGRGVHNFIKHKGGGNHSIV